MTAKNLADLYDLLVEDEGTRLVPYLCDAGFLTIGVGHNIEANPLPKHIAEHLQANGKILLEHAMELLEADVLTCIQEASANFKWFPCLNQARHDVVISMLFNLGLPKFLGFKNFIRCLQIGDYSQASVEMRNSRWCEQVGRRALRLSAMMLTGQHLPPNPALN